MDLTVEQVLALAPDASAAANAKKEAAPKKWQGLGCSDEVLWGLCQGSALYQVQIELGTLTAKCSCPSHKLPCKHSLGLLLLVATNPGAVPRAESPDWVAEWLKKRATSAEQKQAKAQRKDSPADAAAQARRADKRLAQVTAGIQTLDLWLEDLVRNGLAELETQPGSFWEGQAARLVDAQAPGLAGRLRRMAGIPGSGRDWPERLLAELGQTAVLTHTFHRLDQLDPVLQEDVRQQIGWTLGQDEVVARGERIADDWVVLGQWVSDEDLRFRTQRSWLLGTRTSRHALILQFSPKPALPPFAEPILPGTHQEAELAFWPSAYPLRARYVERHGTPGTFAGPVVGVDTLDAALAGVARVLARQPWLDRFLFTLSAVIPLRDEQGRWWVRDHTGAALPLIPGEHWPLLIYSGGAPCDLAGEWDGEALRPLGMGAGGAYHPV
jgi:SWIM zinc finger